MKELNNSCCKKLYEYLLNQCADKINFEVIKLSSDCNMIVGEYEGKKVYLEVSSNDDEIFMYSKNDDVNFLKQFEPIINIYRNGEEPAFQYNTYNVVQDKIVDFTIEWNNNPDKRLEDIKMNRNSNFPYVIRNLSVLFETKEERDRRLGFSSLASCYFPNGDLEPFDEFISMVDTYNEQDCFLVLKTLGSIQSQIFGRTWQGSWCDSVVVADAIDVVLNKISLILENKHNDVNSFLASDEYSSWCNKWNNYFTYDKKCEYMESRLKGEDVSSFVPNNLVQTLKKKNV